MSQKPVFLTPEGLRKLQEELEHYKNVRRPEVATRIHSAKEEGDVTENAEYDDAKNEQAFVEGRILTLGQILNNFVLIQDGGPTDQVDSCRCFSGVPETVRDFLGRPYAP